MASEVMDFESTEIHVDVGPVRTTGERSGCDRVALAELARRWGQSMQAVQTALEREGRADDA